MNLHLNKESTVIIELAIARVFAESVAFC